MKLTMRQLTHLVDEGYVRVPGVVPKIMVDQAVREINHSLGEGVDRDEVPTYRARSYCPELQNQPAIVELATKSQAWELAKSLIGEDTLRPVGGGQIALRFPMVEEPKFTPRPHLDGMYSPLNGVPKGTVRGFSLLMGIVLRDIESDYAGNLMVWPGTHKLHAEYFREHGYQSLLNGMPPVDYPEPVHVIAEAGDVIFAHYLLAHGTAPNLSPNIRYMVYFRLYHTEHDTSRLAEDPWLDFPGVRERVPDLVSAGRP